MKSVYKAVFFDLDHTLWDFESNSRDTLSDLYQMHDLNSKGVGSLQDFIFLYEDVNHKMWDAYSRKEISKEFLRTGRFSLSLKHYGIDDELLVEELAAGYLKLSPMKTGLFPYTNEILNHLHKKYKLVLITNGFSEVQHIKVRHSGLSAFFNHVVVSEEVGFKKPDPMIFHHAVSLSGVSTDDCLMIGDNFDTDISGARAAGIDAVWFTPGKEEKSFSMEGVRQISCLSEVKSFL